MRLPGHGIVNAKPCFHRLPFVTFCKHRVCRVNTKQVEYLLRQFICTVEKETDYTVTRQIPEICESDIFIKIM